MRLLPLPEAWQQEEPDATAFSTLPILLNASCSSSSSSREMVVVLFSILKLERLLQVFISRKNILTKGILAPVKYLVMCVRHTESAVSARSHLEGLADKEQTVGHLVTHPDQSGSRKRLSMGQGEAWFPHPVLL